VQLRLLSYNIHRAIGVDRRFRPERVVEIIRHHDPDIALLQEVDEGVPRSKETDLARDLAEALGYPHYAVGHNVSLRRGRYGNATLSRHPILRERNIDLTIGSRKRRGCQHTTIRVGSREGLERDVEVFNLHLGLSARERTRQVGRLVHSGEFEALTERDRCVVGGDFNDWRSQLHPIFTEILGFDYGAPDRRTNRKIRTYPSFSPRGSLDRVYTRGPIRRLGLRSCRLRLSRVASDHLPLVAEVELR